MKTRQLSFAEEFYALSAFQTRGIITLTRKFLGFHYFPKKRFKKLDTVSHTPYNRLSLEEQRTLEIISDFLISVAADQVTPVGTAADVADLKKQLADKDKRIAELEARIEDYKRNAALNKELLASSARLLDAAKKACKDVQSQVDDLRDSFKPLGTCPDCGRAECGFYVRDRIRYLLDLESRVRDNEKRRADTSL